MAEKKEVKKASAAKAVAVKKAVAAKPAVVAKAPEKTPVAPEKAPVKAAPATVEKAPTKAAPASVAKSITEKPAAVKKSKGQPKKVVEDNDRGLRKTRIGKVVSNKMNKTIVVAIVNKVPHPLYGKVVVTTTKFKAHDEKNECSIGDTVEIMETRPLSRDKYFRLLRIIEKVK